MSETHEQDWDRFYVTNPVGHVSTGISYPGRSLCLRDPFSTPPPQQQIHHHHRYAAAARPVPPPPSRSPSAAHRSSAPSFPSPPPMSRNPSPIRRAHSCEIDPPSREFEPPLSLFPSTTHADAALFPSPPAQSNRRHSPPHSRNPPRNRPPPSPSTNDAPSLPRPDLVRAPPSQSRSEPPRVRFDLHRRRRNPPSPSPFAKSPPISLPSVRETTPVRRSRRRLFPPPAGLLRRHLHVAGMSPPPSVQTHAGTPLPLPQPRSETPTLHFPDLKSPPQRLYRALYRPGTGVSITRLHLPFAKPCSPAVVHLPPSTSTITGIVADLQTRTARTLLSADPNPPPPPPVHPPSPPEPDYWKEYEDGFVSSVMATYDALVAKDKAARALASTPSAPSTAPVSITTVSAPLPKPVPATESASSASTLPALVSVAIPSPAVTSTIVVLAPAPIDKPASAPIAKIGTYPVPIEICVGPCRVAPFVPPTSDVSTIRGRIVFKKGRMIPYIIGPNGGRARPPRARLKDRASVEFYRTRLGRDCTGLCTDPVRRSTETVVVSF